MVRDGRAQFVAEVFENKPLCREHYRLGLRLATFPPTEPGQFVQVACRDLDTDYSPETEIDWDPGQPSEHDQPPAARGAKKLFQNLAEAPHVHAGLRSIETVSKARGCELMSPLALLRRPFSLAGRNDRGDGVELELIHRIVGVGTAWLAELEPGQGVHLLGPLGNRFTLPEPGQPAILVGGGVGIPPMLYLAQKLIGRPAVAFCGAVSRDLLPLTLAAASTGGDDAEPRDLADEFTRHGIRSVLCTDDGSYGFRGLVTQALEKYLDRLPAGDLLIIYTCGPEPMMKRVAQIAAARGLEAQVAVERAMACGMGTCQSCVIRVKRQPDDPANRAGTWAYKLACTDGPIFRGAQLLW